MIKNVTSAAAPARSAGKPRPRRNTQRRSLAHYVKTFFTMLLLFAETIIALVLVCALVVYWNFSAELPNFETLLTETRAPVATKIFSEDGVLLGKLQAENRQPITIADLGSSKVIDATVAIEDHRFYEHPGIDVVGIGRALVANFRGSQYRQGASTLTQQLVRQPGIGQQFGLSSERRFSRKIREALVALRVEQLYSKKEILQLYLNNVYYGAGAYGIEAAAKTYFHKPASKLTLSEAALLAGLPQSPSELSPFRRKQAAIKRRDEVLDAMLEYGKIQKIDYDLAKSDTVALSAPPKRSHFEFKAPYFTTYVLKQLFKNYATDMVYSGLSVKTTLNWKIQQLAEKALLHGLDNASGFGANQGALVSIDPQTGYIRAMVGGRDFRASQYNAVTQGRRQPGSTFKVFDYTAAFDAGECRLNDTFVDKPIPYPNDPSHLVKDYGSGYTFESMTCKQAIEQSTNTVAVQVAQKVGIRKVIAYAYKMGIKTPLAPYLPTALGASAVRPLDLCSAYSIFAAKGTRYHPMAIVKVADAEGNVLDAARYTSQREVNVLKDSTIQQINEALEGVVTEGTGTRARGDSESGIVDNAHGKTGTTSDNRDAWFAGYTPDLTTVVWVASVHKKKNKLVYSEMPGATGGHQCAPIWHDFMYQAVPIQQKSNQLSQHQDAPVAKTVPTEVTPPRVRRRRHQPVIAAAATGEMQTVTKPAENKTTDPQTTPDETPGDMGDPEPAPDTAPGSPARAPKSNSPVMPPPEATRPSVPAPASASPGASLPGDTSSERRASANRIAHAPPSVPRLRLTTPPPRAEAPETVAVRVCGDSGELANAYCETYKTIRVTAAQAARMHRCRLHKPPQGEAQ